MQTVISTDGIAPKDRLHWWGDQVWKLIGRLESDAYGDADFRGRIAHQSVGYLQLCRLDASRHRVIRTPSLIRSSDRAFYKIVAQLRGQAHFEQDQRGVWLRPGDWSIYDTSLAYSVLNPEPVEQLVVMLPKEHLIDRRLPIHELTVQRFSGQLGVARMAYDLMNSIALADANLDRVSGAAVADSLVQLLHLALLERHGQPAAQARRELLRDRIRAYVRRNLRDPELTLERIATELNCSKRNLHSTFSSDGATLADYILASRLDACLEDLRDAAKARHSVTALALSWGFNNASHFSRAFKKRFGMSPSDARAALPCSPIPRRDRLCQNQKLATDNTEESDQV
jgi:AraC-like DNA-binding protein